MTRELLKYHLCIGLIAALLFLPFIGNVHLFDWDEINFAESAREMIVTGDYLNVQAFFMSFSEKPPLFLWMQVLSMKIFGVNEFAARFPNAICGIVTLLVLFNFGRKFYDVKFGSIWVITYACSILPFFYFKSGIIDPWFNLFIFTGIYFYVRAVNDAVLKRESWLVLASAVAIGLAVLSKGPVALLVFALVAIILLVVKKFNLGINWKNVLLYAVVVAFVGGFWFLLQLLNGRFDVVQEFIAYQIRLLSTQDAGHGGFPLFHFVILLVGMFPASVFAIQGHRYLGPGDSKKLIHTSMVVLLWVVLILFSIVKTKIIHYSSLAYFPISFLASYSVYTILEGKRKYAQWQRVILGSIGVLIGIAAFSLPIIAFNKQAIIDSGLIKDEFALGNLQSDTGFGFLHVLIGLILIVGVMVSIFFFRENVKKRLLVLAGSSLIFVYAAVVFITPGIEKISQKALIEFIKEKGQEDAYLITLFKSYAPPYYRKQQLPDTPYYYDKKKLIYGDSVDKKVYLIVRAYQRQFVEERLQYFSYLGEKNGFVFYLRPSN